VLFGSYQQMLGVCRDETEGSLGIRMASTV
jgi:hypothetical protein